ncbi:beta-lactamase hydrolase domain-containing protein [Kordiimonas marina]|uniref:beta-lactamase hydrolase domain-containing protein n=1 Tax=Kordiimonas marina TaxID=2872312 RepID=UPI001FF4057B|nr:sulfur transferase domain-containing protein [Kordiimonas marina]MCJ9429407.1 tyrosine-protein phosphatase [Kordiimonas marina]
MTKLFAAFTLVLGLVAGPAFAADASLSLDMHNMHTPAPGLMTGGQPSKADLEKLKAAGYKVIVNLRLPTEVTKTEDPAKADQYNFPEANDALSLGFQYINLPVKGAAGISEENARTLDAILKAAKGPVLVHCSSGNRAGGLIALRAFYVLHQSKDAALAAGRQAGLTQLEPLVKATLDHAR